MYINIYSKSYRPGILSIELPTTSRLYYMYPGSDANHLYSGTQPHQMQKPLMCAVFVYVSSLLVLLVLLRIPVSFSMPGVASPSNLELLATLSAHVERHLNPLLLLATNPNSVRLKKTDSLDLICTQILDAPTDPALVSAAYKCLYLQASTDVPKLLLQHQRYIVQLSGSKKCGAAFQELWTVAMILQGSRKLSHYSMSSLPQLLAGIPLSSDATSSMVVSHHFLILQTILQYLSANLQSVVKGASSMTLLIFQEVANAFLSSSNHQLWVGKFASDEAASRKYQQNNAKVLAGFLKVANFLKPKIPSNEMLDLGISLLELKALEISLQLGDLQDKSLEVTSHSSISTPFLHDLRTVASPHFSTLPKIEAFFLAYTDHEVSMTSTDSIASILKELKNSNDSKILLKASILTKEVPISELLTALTSFPQLLVKSLDPQLAAGVLGSILSRLLKNIDQKENMQVIMLTCDKIVSQSKQLDASLFQVLLKGTFIPLSAIYFENEQTTRLKQISKACFHFSLIPDALIHASKLDLLTLSPLQSKSELSRLKSRAEYAICKLANVGAFENSLDLFLEYRKALPEICIGPSVISSLVDCLSDSPDRILLLFRLGLILPNPVESIFYDQLFDEVVSRGSPRSLINALSSVYNPQDSESRLRQIYRASAFSFQQIDDIFELNENAPDEILYIAGIHTFNLCHSDDLYEASLGLAEKYLRKWIACKSISVKDKEEKIFSDILHELFYCSHFQIVDQIIEEYLRASENRITQLALSLELLLCRAKIENLNTAGISEALKRSGSLMKQLNVKGEDIQYNQVMIWKLLQFEYLIIMNDITKSNEKFSEIKRFLNSKPGYSYQDTKVELSVKQKLENFLILARFLILSSKLNMVSGDYMSGFKNIKLAMKLLNSILRKLDLGEDFVVIKKDTEYFLLQSYRMAFQVSRHLGLSKDAIHYVHELRILNSCNQYPMMKTFYHFELANYFCLIGKPQESLHEFSSGSKIANNLHFQTLRLCMNISALLSRVLFESDDRDLIMKEKTQLKYSMENSGSSTSDLKCLSPRYLNESFLDLEYFFIKKYSGMPLINFENDRRKMLLKTALDVKYKIRTLEEDLLINSDVQLRSNPKVLPGTTHPSFFSEEISRKLSECKEILLKFTEKENFPYLSVNQLFDISNLLACCVFSLSFVSAMKEEMASTLLESMHFLQDLAKDMPNINQRSLLSKTSAVNDLLPSTKSESINFSNDAFNARLKQLLPQSWIAVSLDICEFTGNFIISKYSSCMDFPVYYKLPIKGTSKFRSFGDIAASLDLIIKDSNASTKKDVTELVKTKEDRRNWWRFRFELDQRLKELLDEVEHGLLGGFKSIFNYVDSLTHNYDDFRKEMTKHLASFVGLPAGLEFNLSPGLVGLFYSFIFSDEEYEDHHFDDLIRYTYTELTGNPDLSAASPGKIKKLTDEIRNLCTGTPSEESGHIVLIPSKSCASFPWESMSCLKNKSVSRMPSVGQLLHLLESHKDLQYPKSSTNEIFYLVNPGKDLQKTQAEFGPILENMENASGLCGKNPEESYMVDLLYRSKLFLYLGHGGGEQYARASTMMKIHAEDTLKRLPPALLMGCSSGSFHQNGQLEPTSNIYNWLSCGSPLVVSNLWDITDKDIDKFSLSVFRRWGLFAGNEGPTENICNAISNSRSTCILRYLNGAAPIVYGLPFNYS